MVNGRNVVSRTARAASVAIVVVSGILAGCTDRTTARGDVEAVRSALVTACDYSVVTAHNSNARLGAQSCETTLTPYSAPYAQKIASQTFGGPITGQPLLVHGNLINGVVQDGLVVVANVTSSTGPGGSPILYVLNPLTLQPIIQATLPATDYCGNHNSSGTDCYGVLSTPVIDKAANVVYVVLSTLSGVSGLPEYDLFAYNLNNLFWIAGANIGGTCKNSTTNEVFSAYNASTHQPQQRQRPALLLDHGHVYIAFGSSNNESITDTSNGWIFAYNTYSGSSTLTAAGQPYCTTRGAPANGWGRGGIWQMGAGISADAAGNVYAGVGNGRIGDGTPNASSTNDDGESYVQVAGATWTGALSAKFLMPDYNQFLAPNEIEGANGPIVLSTTSSGQYVLGSNKQGLFTLLQPNGAMHALQGPFRGAYNQYGAILGDPSNLELNSIACNAANSCDSNGFPVTSGGSTVCCPGGCSCPSGQTGSCSGYTACGPLVHGSHPHIHGQPSFLADSSGISGTIFWWGEKDYPRFAKWSGSTQGITPVTGSSLPVDNVLNRLSNSSSDLAPTFQVGDGNSGMPGGLTALASNGTLNATLWANVPENNVDPPTDAYLKAFDVSGTFPKQHVFQVDLGSAQYHGYPTVANGVVYIATGVGLQAYSNRPPPSPAWANPFPTGNCALSLGSGWVIGCDPDSNGNGHAFRWIPGTGWTLPDGGATRGTTISVDLNGTPWITNSSGAIFKFSWSLNSFQAFQPGSPTCATSVASGSVDTETWFIGCNGMTYNWNGSGWTQVSMTPTSASKIAVFSNPDSVCGRHLPWIMTPGSPAPAFWQGAIDGTCTTYSYSSTPYTGFDLTTDFLLGTDGKLYTYNGTTLTGPYATTPWGTASKIAGWTGGIYAAQLNVQNDMQVIQAQ